MKCVVFPAASHNELHQQKGEVKPLVLPDTCWLRARRKKRKQNVILQPAEQQAPGRSGHGLVPNAAGTIKKEREGGGEEDQEPSV